MLADVDDVGARLVRLGYTSIASEHILDCAGHAGRIGNVPVQVLVMTPTDRQAALVDNYRPVSLSVWCSGKGLLEQRIRRDVERRSRKSLRRRHVERSASEVFEPQTGTPHPTTAPDHAWLDHNRPIGFLPFADDVYLP
jgi:hypothetical protein